MCTRYQIFSFLLLIICHCKSLPVKINKDITKEGTKIYYFNKTLPQNESNIWSKHKLNATEFNTKFEEEPKSSEEMMIFKSISNALPVEIVRDKNDKVNDQIEDRIDKIIDEKNNNDKPLIDRTQADESYVSEKDDKINRSFKQNYASLVKEFVRSTVLEELNKDYFKNNQEPSSLYGVAKKEIIKSLTDNDGPDVELENSEYNHQKYEIPDYLKTSKKRIRNVHSGLYGGVQMFNKGKGFSSGVYRMKTPDVIYDPNPKDDDRSYESESNYNKPSNDYYKSTGSNPPSVHEISSTEELDTSEEDSKKFKSILDSFDNYPLVRYPKSSKHIYVHVPPPESSEEDTSKEVQTPPPEKNYKIIFIKTPEQKTKPPVIPPLPQKEEKTLVYVLVKKPEEVTVTIPTPASTLPSKPEVFYIRYKQKNENKDEKNVGKESDDEGFEHTNYEYRGIENRNIEDRDIEDKGIEVRDIEERGIEERGIEERGIEERGIEDRDSDLEYGAADNKEVIALTERNEVTTVTENKTVETKQDI